jgi:hypothetical protein
MSGIFIDGVDLNQKYQPEGSYYSYEIKGKKCDLALKSGCFYIRF